MLLLLEWDCLDDEVGGGRHASVARGRNESGSRRDRREEERKKDDAQTIAAPRAIIIRSLLSLRADGIKGNDGE
jgi:hypothetical protein